MKKILFAFLFLGLIVVISGCNLFVKKLYLSVPPRINAGISESDLDRPINPHEGTISLAYPVPDPTDGTSADLTVHLTATGTGKDHLDINPGAIEIPRGASTGTFEVSASFDGTAKPEEDVTITAEAVGYDGESATITIHFPAPAIEDGTLTIGVTVASGITILYGVYDAGADPLTDPLRASGEFDLFSGTGSITATDFYGDWIGTGGNSYDVYIWMDMDGDYDTVQYAESGVDMQLKILPVTVEIDGNISLTYLGSAFETVP